MGWKKPEFLMHTFPPPPQRASLSRLSSPRQTSRASGSILQCHMAGFICILPNFPVQLSHSDDCTISSLCSHSGSHPRSHHLRAETSVSGDKSTPRRRCRPGRGLRDRALQCLAGWRCGFCEGEAAFSTGLPSPSPPSFLGI